VALFGVATSVVVFLATRRLTSTAGALAAGLFVAVTPMHADHSHYLTTDVPSAAMTALTLVLALIGRDRGRRWLVAAGIAAGLAASTKYNAGLVVVVPLAVHLLLIHRGRELVTTRFWSVVLLIVLGSMVGFAVATPAIIFDTSNVIATIQFQAERYNTAFPGAEGNSAAFYLRTLMTTGVGPPLCGLAVVGMIMAVRRRGPGVIAALVFTCSYLILISNQLVHFERNLMPVIPFLAVFGGIGVGAIIDVARKVARASVRPSLRRSAITVLAAALLVAFAAPLNRVLDNDRYLQLPDSRTAARTWIGENIAPGTAIIREDYTPFVSGRDYRVGYVWLLYGRPLDWYRSTGARYLIASSAQFSRYSDYPNAVAFYEELFALGVVYQSPPGQPLRGPTIVIVDIGLPIGENRGGRDEAHRRIIHDGPSATVTVSRRSAQSSAIDRSSSTLSQRSFASLEYRKPSGTGGASRHAPSSHQSAFGWST
jgi:4-amino-4-deoxy-L-arabinose transferase-like glycosyltransferase